MDSSNRISAEEKVIFWISEIHQNTEKFKNEFSSMSEDRLLFKPTAQTWSIAENIQHLIEVNQSYYPIFTQLLAQTYRPPWSGKFRFINKLFGNLILKSVNEDRKKKIKTFTLWVPNELPPAKDVLSRFEAHQLELIGWIKKLEAFIDKLVIINSPANKIVSYTLDDAIEIIIMHEKRHLNQAIEVKRFFK